MTVSIQDIRVLTYPTLDSESLFDRYPSHVLIENIIYSPCCALNFLKRINALENLNVENAAEDGKRMLSLFLLFDTLALITCDLSVTAAKK